MEEEELLIYEIQARFCKAMSHPKRIFILNVLKNHGEMTVSELVKATKIPQSNLSQHLTFLRNSGLVKIRREGPNVYYNIANPKIIEACNIIREVIIENIKKMKDIYEDIKED